MTKRARYVPVRTKYVHQRKDLRDAQPYIPPGHTRGFDPEEPPEDWDWIHHLATLQAVQEGQTGMAPLTSLYVDSPALNPMMGWTVDA